MKGIEAGDWPAWLALSVALAHLAWNIWDRVSAWSARRSAGIALNRYMVDGDILVKVTWLHAQAHTNYRATVRLLAPAQSRLQPATAIWLDRGGGGFIAAPHRVYKPDGVPARHLTMRVAPEGESFGCRFFVIGLARVDEPFRVEIAIVDNATGSTLAKTRQSLAWVLS